MALPIVPLLVLGGGLLLAVASSSKKSAPSGGGGAPPSPTAISPADAEGLAAWMRANLTPAQVAAIGGLMQSSIARKGYVDAHDLCASLASALSAAQMADVVSQFPVLSTCFDPNAAPPDVPAPAPPAPTDEIPVVPDATPGAPAPPPIPAPDAGGGGAAPQIPGSVIPNMPPPPNPPAPMGGGYDDALARQLAPSIESNIKSKKAKYDRVALQRFQVAAGLVADGLYGGSTAGALHYFLGHTPPKPLFPPMSEQPYKASEAKEKSKEKKPAVTPHDGSAEGKAAGELATYLKASGDFGSKAKPSSTVKSYQLQMKGGLKADGIVGPKTRARAKALGVTLPDEWHASTGPATVKPAAHPATPAGSAQQQAAIELGSYLARTADFGSKAKPSSTVKSYQSHMGGITADGIVGPKTRARASALGVQLPAAPAAGAAAKPAAPAAHAAVPSANVNQQAAIALGTYLSQSHSFGSKQKPDATVKTYQAQMGGITADGIVGPKTRARASALGVQLPAATGGDTTAQKTAAVQLGTYLSQSHSFGTKAKPDATVKTYQAQMGGITADGIVGPKTRARASALGVQLPAASSAAPAHAPAPAAAPASGVAQQQKNAAYNLGQYLAATHSFGTKAKPDATVKTYQAQMGGLTADGIIGPKSRARATALGVQLPAATGGAAAGLLDESLPSAPADAAEARRLARIVVQDVQQNGQRGFTRSLVSNFQRAAGLPVTGIYDGRVVGALKYFGGKRAPRAAGDSEIAYMPAL